MMTNFRRVIAVDFDGVLCNSTFPYANSQNTFNKLILWYVKHRQRKGDLIALWTCREYIDSSGTLPLQIALEFLWDKGFIPDMINENSQDRTDHYGISSRKISADIYIDDRNFGFIGWTLRTVHRNGIKRRERKYGRKDV